MTAANRNARIEKSYLIHILAVITLVISFLEYWEIWIDEHGLDYRLLYFKAMLIYWLYPALALILLYMIEVLAYLIDKRGALVSEDEIRYLLWSESEDTEKKRRYVRNIISDVRTAFKAYGLDDIIINNDKAFYGINRDKLKCDLYDYLDGHKEISEDEAKLYMEQYYWAEL